MAERFPGATDTHAHSVAVGVRAGAKPAGDVDTMRRYIYIHGSPDRSRWKAGIDRCVRMRNRDISSFSSSCQRDPSHHR